MSILVERRESMILLSNKKEGAWYQLRFDATVIFEKMDENEGKEAFEELVHELRKELHMSFELPKTEKQ